MVIFKCGYGFLEPVRITTLKVRTILEKILNRHLIWYNSYWFCEIVNTYCNGAMNAHCNPSAFKSSVSDLDGFSLVGFIAIFSKGPSTEVYKCG